MSNLEEYAKKELDKIVATCGKDEEAIRLQKEINKNIMEIVKAFAAGNHSGFTGLYVINIIEKLLRFEPLTPLTGEKGEWIDVGEGVLQNNRCYNVFKENGKAHINTNMGKVEIEFPYTVERK